MCHHNVVHYNINSLRPRLNRRPFADDIFKCIFLNENEWISPRISLKFVPMVRINNIQALVQIMAWHRSGGKPLSEPMMVSLLTHICVTRPQWVILHTTLPKLRQNISHSLYSYQTPHTSPSWVSNGVSVVEILEITNHIIMAPNCISQIYLFSWHEK